MICFQKKKIDNLQVLYGLMGYESFDKAIPVIFNKNVL